MVLIIEDDDPRVAHQELLEVLGFRVTSVSSGADALDALRVNDLHAVLRDDERVRLTPLMRKPVDLDAVAAWLREVAPMSSASGQR